MYICVIFKKQLNNSEEILLKNPYKHNGTITSTVLKKTSSKFTKKAYIESYGCQMNFSDSEVVASYKEATSYGDLANGPYPPASTIFTEVYETVPWHVQEQREELGK